MRARRAASKARLAAASEAERSRLVRELFAQPTRDYLYQVLGRPVAVLRAGVQAPIEELGLRQLRASGYDISVMTVDTAASCSTGSRTRSLCSIASSPRSGRAVCSCCGSGIVTALPGCWSG